VFECRRRDYRVAITPDCALGTVCPRKPLVPCHGGEEVDKQLVHAFGLVVVHPVRRVGQALHAARTLRFDLVDSRADSKGVTIQVYRRTGRPQYATATTDHDEE
jgi:hypothetical protein